VRESDSAAAHDKGSRAEAGERRAGGGRGPAGPLRELGCTAGARLGRRARGAGLPSGAGPRLAAVLCGLLGQIGEWMGRLGKKVWKFLKKAQTIEFKL
jgi:hypothetical protein